MDGFDSAQSEILAAKLGAHSNHSFPSLLIFQVQKAPVSCSLTPISLLSHILDMRCDFRRKETALYCFLK
ncbi:hypothetical protein AVEN_77314-1, partial [Araneus ventricosus]